MAEYEDTDLLSETEKIFWCIIFVVILALIYGSLTNTYRINSEEYKTGYKIGEKEHNISKYNASIYISQNPTKDTGYFIFISKEEKTQVEKNNAIYNYALGYIDGYEHYQSNKQEAEQAQIKNTTLAESRAVLGY